MSGRYKTPSALEHLLIPAGNPATGISARILQHDPVVLRPRGVLRHQAPPLVVIHEEMRIIHTKWFKDALLEEFIQ